MGRHLVMIAILGAAAAAAACGPARSASPPPSNTAHAAVRAGVAGVMEVLEWGGTVYFLGWDALCQPWVAHPDRGELIYDYPVNMAPGCSRNFREELWYSLADGRVTLVRRNLRAVSEHGCGGHADLGPEDPATCSAEPTQLEDAGGGAVAFSNRMLLFLDEDACKAALDRSGGMSHNGMCRD